MKITADPVGFARTYRGAPEPCERLTMPTATVLLVSRDHRLIETVKDVAGSLGDLRLEVLPDVDTACTRLEQGGAALVLVHVPEGGDLSAVTGLLERITALESPTA